MRKWGKSAASAEGMGAVVGEEGEKEGKEEPSPREVTQETQSWHFPNPYPRDQGGRQRTDTC